MEKFDDDGCRAVDSVACCAVMKSNMRIIYRQIFFSGIKLMRSGGGWFGASEDLLKTGSFPFQLRTIRARGCCWVGGAGLLIGHPRHARAHFVR
jgi:hypothetical protein